MTHELTFIHFKEYINTKRDHFKIYHDIYCLIKLYKTKLEALDHQTELYKENAEYKLNFKRDLSFND